MMLFGSSYINTRNTYGFRDDQGYPARDYIEQRFNATVALTPEFVAEFVKEVEHEQGEFDGRLVALVLHDVYQYYQFSQTDH